MDYLQRILSTSFNPSSVALASTCSYSHELILNSVPSAYSGLSAVLLKDNLNFIPGEWKSGDIFTAFYDVSPSDPCVADAFTHIKSANFIAWHESFFPIIGHDARLEVIQTFPPDEQNVHEAPVYIPETNELLYSDTSAVGQLWAINIDTQILRQISLSPPLSNINGATSHRGQIYVATNGGPARGIHPINHTTGATSAPIVNNFRGRHLNSPNDLIFDSSGNLYFTDPTYGWTNRWRGVGAPELPASIYRLDARTRALTVVSTGMLVKPNGLALSADERTLYVADSASTTVQGPGTEVQRAVWEFEVVASSGALRGPRLVYVTEAGWPDGLRVTEAGWLMVAVLGGVDLVDPRTGALLGRISTPGDVIFNLEPARGRKGVWLLTGKRGIYKATIKEGPVASSWVARSKGEVMRLAASWWR